MASKNIVIRNEIEKICLREIGYGSSCNEAFAIAEELVEEALDEVRQMLVVKSIAKLTGFQEDLIKVVWFNGVGRCKSAAFQVNSLGFTTDFKKFDFDHEYDEAKSDE